jgi:hypothetical protein
MLRSVAFLIVIGLTLAANAAQGAGQPLQIGPGTTTPESGAKVPSNWKITSGGQEALSEQTSRMAITLPKSNPVIDGKSVTTGLVLRCEINPSGPPVPQVMVLFTSLTGVGHFKKFQTRYRFDEGPVRSMELKSIIGKNYTRAIVLQNQAAPAPDVEIVGATRLRIEFDFKSAGVTFLDFNVSGAVEALKAISCQ